MTDNTITTKDDWRRFNGAWKWGVAIPAGDETIRIVCPQCGSTNAHSDRVGNDVYGWCTKDCGWQGWRPITPEWNKAWEVLRSQLNKADIT